MGSLYLKKEINEFLIKSSDINWKKVISIIFKDNKYNFCLNSELIDTDDRFRIIKINNKTYIIKKTTLDKAKKERENALKLKKILNKIIIDGYNIEPVVPLVVDSNQNGYIVSEYKGYTLQESLYDKRKSKILSFSIFSKIVNLLLEKRILYRGFIPRNIIIKKNTIYLIDFEDIILKDDCDSIKLNTQYKTNFILNWQYFYDIQDLDTIMNKYNFSCEDNIELLTFEKYYKLVMGVNYNNKDLRAQILKTVTNAEKPYLVRKTNSYNVLPTDLVHLLSDLYGYYLDVIVDLFLENLRDKDETDFINFMMLNSYIIKTYNGDLYRLKTELFDLLIKSIKLSLNNERIHKSNINKACVESNEIVSLVKLFLNSIESKIDENTEQQLVYTLKMIGGEYGVF